MQIPPFRDGWPYTRHPALRFGYLGILLLLVSLATASLIVLQAQYANASQRATVESVLHDYSSLIADEVIRRSSAEVAYYAYYPLIGTVLHEVQASGKLPTKIKVTLLSEADPRLRRAAGLAKGYFEMDPMTAQISQGRHLAIVQTISLKTYSFHRTRNLAPGNPERYTCISYIKDGGRLPESFDRTTVRVLTSSALRSTLVFLDHLWSRPRTARNS
jgi:hypothetical protein